MAVESITSNDVRYPDLVQGNNLRFVGTPDAVYLPRNATEVADCVKRLVGAKTRFTVRSGGHCYEDHVFNRGVRAVIDLGLLRQVAHDPTTGCIAVDSGQSLWDVYLKLHRGWGVTIPGGSCATVGAGGHIVGGGYGLLSRRNGLTVDHLHGVEVVTADGEIRVVTRDNTGADRDLWWAHTGGGGGNFGVVTRYLLRTPAAPAGTLLPRAPRQVLLHDIVLTWDKLGTDGAQLRTMLRRFSEWCEHNSAHDAGTRNDLFALFRVFPRLDTHARAIHLTTQVAIDDHTPERLRAARDVLKEFLASVLTVGAPTPQTIDAMSPLPWLNATHQLGQGTWDRRADYKSAYHRRLNSDQISALVTVFAAAGKGADGARVSLDTYGGKVNATAKGATATPHRDSVIKAQYFTLWADPAEDEAHIQWLRKAYSQVYAGTGGIPAACNDKPGTVDTDGCFVNYLDADLPAPLGTVPAWWQLYYGDTNFAKLVKVKATFHSGNVFQHAQSIPTSMPKTTGSRPPTRPATG
ncbi:FAD-dependent oxidoreductase [Actinosynnema sp. ALI-1.44]|uniref:FAD-dependent oxidoreductase n=1 Tax=Actinosynnema sp. ALI-1.44 TaxID=1933779 RepID=UPI0009FC5BB9|nr:FAD-binding protein [Actinosynnema sp. ALI-1.44]